MGGDAIAEIIEGHIGVSIHAPAWGATRRPHDVQHDKQGFDPRPRVGGDTLDSSVNARDLAFRSTPPRGGRLIPSRDSVLVSWFRSTPPRGGRRCRRMGIVPWLPVSIHAPAWGATRWTSPGRDRPRGFDPRPRVGGDAGRQLVLARLDVSIHAPAWGATCGLRHVRNRFPVSIHAPAWGATGYQLRSRHRRAVSIHAPAWGATQNIAGNAWIDEFRSTPPRGGRLLLSSNGRVYKQFRSTPPRGGRRAYRFNNPPIE